jgi:hypothetical protein
MRWRLVLATSCVLATTAVPARVLAQEAPPPAADCSKQEEDAKGGDVEAKRRLGECYERAGRAAAAWSVYKPIGDARADALEPKLGKLVVTVEDTGPVDVQRDGAPVAKETVGAPAAVDPGEHVVVVTAPGKKKFERRVAVAAGETQTVTVPKLEDETKAPPPPGEEANPGGTQRTVGVIVAIAGLVAVGTATGLALAAQSRFDDASSHCYRGACDADGIDARKSGLNLSNASTILFVGGGAAILSGAALWLLAPRAKTTGALRVLALGAW